MNINDLTDEEINRAHALLVREHRSLAKAGIVGIEKRETVLTAIWVIAALLRKQPKVEYMVLSPRAKVREAAKTLLSANGADLEEWSNGNFPPDADDFLKPLAGYYK